MEIERVFGNFPTLETERLLLRKVTPDDAESMYEYGTNEEVARYVTWNAHRSVAETEGFIQFILRQYENKQLAPWGIEFKENGKFIGTIDFVSWQPNHNTAEIGYVLSQDYWGKGVMTGPQRPSLLSALKTWTSSGSRRNASRKTSVPLVLWKKSGCRLKGS